MKDIWLTIVGAVLGLIILVGVLSLPAFGSGGAPALSGGKVCTEMPVEEAMSSGNDLRLDLRLGIRSPERMQELIGIQHELVERLAGCDAYIQEWVDWRREQRARNQPLARINERIQLLLNMRDAVEKFIGINHESIDLLKAWHLGDAT